MILNSKILTLRTCNLPHAGVCAVVLSIYLVKFILEILNVLGGTWWSQLEEYATLDLEVMTLRPTLGETHI